MGKIGDFLRSSRNRVNQRRAKREARQAEIDRIQNLPSEDSPEGQKPGVYTIEKRKKDIKKTVLFSVLALVSLLLVIPISVLLMFDIFGRDFIIALVCMIGIWVGQFFIVRKATKYGNKAGGGARLLAKITNGICSVGEILGIFVIPLLVILM